MARTLFISGIFFVSVFGNLALADTVAEPNLVAWWKLDEGEGITAQDSAGDNDGTIYGAAWTSGQINDALDFNGVDDYVEVPDDASLRFNEYDSFTISCWALPITDEQNGWLVCKMQPSAQSHCFTYETSWHSSESAFGFTISRANSTRWVSIGSGVGTAPAEDWYHVAWVYDNGDMKIYVNGQLSNTGTFPYNTDGASSNNLAIGARLIISQPESGRFFDGTIDDVHIYDRALSDGEIDELYHEGLYKAFAPNPADGAVGVDSNTVLSWRPGKHADLHDVYLGTDYNDVNDANTSSSVYMGNFDVNSFDPCGLDIMTTYYWRVDEVNEANSDVWKGDIWSFSTTLLIELSATEFSFWALEDGNNPDDQILTIRNSGGTYTGPGNRDIDFKGKAITVRSTNPNDPNVVANTIIDCEGTEEDPHRGFYFHNNEDSNSVLEGLTIINGYAGAGTLGGGAICCDTSSPKISKCVLYNNKTHRFSNGGAGVCCFDSNAIIVDCNLIDNIAFTWGTAGGPVNGYGGGLACYYGSPTIIDCIITQNLAENEGGGIYCYESNTTTINSEISNNAYENIYCQDSNVIIANSTITNYEKICTGYCSGGIISAGSYLEVQDCTIAGNTYWNGGGIYSYNSSTLIVSNCKIEDNVARWRGGGIRCYNDSSITNCVIAQNIAAMGGELGGGGIYCDGNPIISNCSIADNDADIGLGFGGGIWCNNSPTIENCIIWNNKGGQIARGSPIVTFSNIQGSYSGSGNIDSDPCFADPYNFDYHLQSQAGRWDPNIEDWVIDANTSLCIDAGNPGCPLGDEPNDINNLRINMGAYGGTAQASKNPAGWYLLADLTNDRQVTFNDLEAFVNNWLDNGRCIPSDLNIDERVDFADFAVFAEDWLWENQ